MLTATRFVDQSATNLQLALVEGELDTSQFDVLCQQASHISGVEVRAGIIGASHFVSIRSGKETISEVFSCLKTVNGNVSGFYPLVNAERQTRQQFGDIHYAFNAQTLYDDRALTQLEHLEALIERADGTTSIGLNYAFPRSDLMTYDPKTLVHVASSGKRMIVIETAHSYPQERAVVFSRTTIEHRS